MATAIVKPLVRALALSAALGWAAAGNGLQTPPPPPSPGHAGPGHSGPGHAGQALKATLVGTTEVPGPGDADGTGTATVTIDPVAGQLCYAVKVENVEGVTMAHIHRAPMGSMGDVVAPLAPPTAGTSEGCIKVRPELAAAILAVPGDFYVNVHSQPNPAGAVRGQLGK